MPSRVIVAWRASACTENGPWMNRPSRPIIVSLSPKIHPRGYLRLTPSEGGMAISWACRSNLPVEALGGPDGFCRSDVR